jgi:CheY-like chemotaxis protein
MDRASMRETPLSSKIVLILAGQSDITSSLNDYLKKEVSKVYRASIPHEAMVQAILAEPDFILIEVAPSDVSGLQFPEMLRQIKGMEKLPFFFIYADKKSQDSFQKKIEPVYFLDQEKIPALIAMMKTGRGPAPALRPADRSRTNEVQNGLSARSAQAIPSVFGPIADKSFRASDPQVGRSGRSEEMEEKVPRPVYATQGVNKRERVESPLPPRISRRESKELDVLEKLGQLGIIKKT